MNAEHFFFQLAPLGNVLGWYHSHPGYGCWLSGIDVTTQSTNQKFQDPFVAVVVSFFFLTSPMVIFDHIRLTRIEPYLRAKLTLVHSVPIQKATPQQVVVDLNINPSPLLKLKILVFMPINITR